MHTYRQTDLQAPSGEESCHNAHVNNFMLTNFQNIFTIRGKNLGKRQ